MNNSNGAQKHIHIQTFSLALPLSFSICLHCPLSFFLSLCKYSYLCYFPIISLLSYLKHTLDLVKSSV